MLDHVLVQDLSFVNLMLSLFLEFPSATRSSLDCLGNFCYTSMERLCY